MDAYVAVWRVAAGTTIAAAVVMAGVGTGVSVLERLYVVVEKKNFKIKTRGMSTGI